MTCDEEQVAGLVDAIWSSMLGLEARPDRRAIGRIDRLEAIVGRVEISGAWRGFVALACDAALARRAASVMFGISTEAATLIQVEDALCELANMTGGGFKSLLPEPCQMSLPRVERRPMREVDEAGVETVIRFGFVSSELPFTVAFGSDEAITLG